MSNNALVPAGEYQVIIHRLSRIGQSGVYTLHCSIIETGERLMLKAFKFHVQDLIGATLHQADGCEQFNGCQVIVKIAVDPEFETNKLVKIIKVKNLIPVTSDVVVKAPEREYCEFGGL